MANNYLQFSFMLSGVTPEKLKYFEELCEGYFDREEMHPCQWEIESNDALWLYAEEYGDPGGLADILSSYLRKFDPKGVISFTWATTCSKLRVDEFGGGATVIEADIVHFMDAGNWVYHTKAGLGGKNGTDHTEAA